MDKTYIPEISDERLAELMLRFFPLVRNDLGLCYLKDPGDPRMTSYPWADSGSLRIPATGLQLIGDFITYPYYGFFKPSIAEVLAQLPEKYLKYEKCAFYVKGPETAADLNAHSKEVNDGYHVATTTIYLITNPQEIPQ